MAMSRQLDAFLARIGRLLDSAPTRMPATVPVCRCAGRCRCAGLVPALLLRQIEQECEFYRPEM